MKRLPTSLLAALATLSGSLLGAEPESSFGLAPSAAPQLAPANPQSLPLIPEAPQPAQTPEPKKGAAEMPHGDRTTMAEDELNKRIALRKAKVKAERDPEMQALMAKALVAHTDFEQRNLYIEYFTKLVDRIAKFNPGMKKEDIDTLKASYTGRFYQTRVEPTIDPAVARAEH